MTEIVKSRSDVTFILVLFVVLTIIGVAVGGFFVRDYARARASAGWPVVEGVVLSERARRPAHVRYAYSYLGRTYESTRERSLSARLFHGADRDYAPGEAVQVFVDPERPAYSVLSTGGAGAAFIVFSLASGLCIFLGLGGVVWTFSDGLPALSASRAAPETSGA